MVTPPLLAGMCMVQLEVRSALLDGVFPLFSLSYGYCKLINQNTDQLYEYETPFQTMALQQTLRSRINLRK